MQRLEKTHMSSSGLQGAIPERDVNYFPLPRAKGYPSSGLGVHGAVAGSLSLL